MTRPLIVGLVGLLSLVVAGCDQPPPSMTCGGEPGSRACACRGDGTCDADLACVAGVCSAQSASGLVLPAGARGCDVLLAEGDGTAVATVHFAATTRGTFVREAPHVAISVVSASDADIATGAVQVSFAGAAPSIASAHCVDAAGAAISGATVSLQ